MRLVPRRPYSYTMPDWSIAVGSEVVVRAITIGRQMTVMAYSSYMCPTMNLLLKNVAAKVETDIAKLPFPYAIVFEHTDTEQLQPAATMAEVRILEKELRRKLWAQGKGVPQATGGEASSSGGKGGKETNLNKRGAGKGKQ